MFPTSPKKQCLVSKTVLGQSHKGKHITSNIFHNKRKTYSTIRSLIEGCDLIIPVMESTTEETMIELGRKKNNKY